MDGAVVVSLELGTVVREAETAVVDTGETTIYVERVGSGPGVLLLHGFPQTLAMWRDIAPNLATRFSVVCADLRGYGASGCPPSAVDHEPYSKRAMARDMVAVMTELGNGTQIDYDKALGLLKSAAQRGNLRAKVELGNMYHSGRGVPKNDGIATAWYREAAEGGSADGQTALADAYLQGKGVTQNLAEALKWNKRAADQGSAIAQNRGCPSVRPARVSTTQAPPVARPWAAFAWPPPRMRPPATS